MAFALALGLAAAAFVDGLAAATFSTGGVLESPGPDNGRPPEAARPIRPAVSGEAKIIDGDTIEVAGRRIRLEGIDAPEAGQTCAGRLFGRWGCGAAATAALADIIAGGEVACESHGNDKYGRMLGICYAGGIDINARMVRDGHAWAFVKYSQTYVEVENEARMARRGIFATDNEPAWDFRAHRWANAEQAAPEGCAIKGNISRSGHIYHMPWSPWYGRISVDAARGERWFCSEAEAIAAGWRPAHGT